MATKTEVMDRALVKAGVLPYDQTATAEQTTIVEAVFDSLHAYGVDQGFIRWELTDIPAELDNAITVILAANIAEDFGIPTERYNRLKLAEQAAMNKIYAYNELPYSGTQDSCYF